MGSLYKLTYQLTMKNTDREKEMIDEIRCRNGNLEINVSPNRIQWFPNYNKKDDEGSIIIITPFGKENE